jgi:hypothetical protein
LVKKEEKAPLKKYAIKPPRDLTSRFEREQESKRQADLKAQEEKRLREEEERILVGSCWLRFHSHTQWRDCGANRMVTVSPTPG